MSQDSTKKVLVVDDEPDVRHLFSITLKRMGIDCVLADCLREAERLIDTQSFALCLTDMRLPDGDGLDLISFVQKNRPEMPIAIISAHGSVGIAIEAMKRGSFDFLTKPINLEELRQLINSALRLGAQREESDDSRLIGNSNALRALKSQIRRIARSQAPVHIFGESGTGKELVARLIHDLGSRQGEPFIAVNCGAIPSELMESEFFGHKKGAFTGAIADKQGLFQSAHGGTLLLDEVAELPLPMQVKLLRAIQERRVRPVGSDKEEAVDVRLLSATHQPLDALVRTKRFREDLFYRIHVIDITVPPLRNRAEDIDLLAEHLLARLAKRLQSEAPQLTEAALAALRQHSFPGNVRELENILERALAFHAGANFLDAADLEFPRDVSLQDSAKEEEEEAAESGEEGGVAATSVTSPSPATSTAPALPLDGQLEAVERRLLLDALTKTAGNKSKAAKLLGISFRSLRYRLQKLGID